MSLMRLLSAGKSLVGVTDNTSRYRMGNQGMMPKFGSGRNPFRSRVKKTEGRGEAVARPLTPTPLPLSLIDTTHEAGPSLSPSLSAIALATADGGEGAGEEALNIPGVSETPGRRPALRRMFGGWVEKIKARIPRRATKDARAATSRLANVPMQGELSLDKIKVVRNDLSDTDFEIAPREPAAPSPGAEEGEQKLKTATKAEPAAKADTGRSRRLSGRLDEPRRPVTAAAARNPVSGQSAAGAMLSPAGAGWFAPVPR